MANHDAILSRADIRFHGRNRRGGPTRDDPASRAAPPRVEPRQRFCSAGRPTPVPIRQGFFFPHDCTNSWSIKRVLGSAKWSDNSFLWRSNSDSVSRPSARILGFAVLSRFSRCTRLGVPVSTDLTCILVRMSTTPADCKRQGNVRPIVPSPFVGRIASR